MITKAVGRIYQGKYKEVHSMLIFKDGKLVFEEYYEGHKYKWDGVNHHGELVTWDRDMLHNLMSANKSITSACIGIAIDEGFIGNVNQSIFDYLPEHQHLKKDGKESITIEHLLTMTAGLEWEEWSAPYSTTANPAVGIWFSEEDPITYILDMPLIDEPGTNYNYSTGNTIVLGEIIRHATNMDVNEFYKTYLFEPLAVYSSLWPEIFDNGVYGNSIAITPRAAAKFGVTFLNGGVWNGTRIISEEWVDKSATPFPGNTGIDIPDEPSGELGYSYTWWTKRYSHSGGEINMYSASGWGGQHIMVLPGVNMVVVFTGGNYVSFRPPFQILERFILPAIE
jgi:CubicO group peptidase (beta-lactamase class C family)